MNRFNKFLDTKVTRKQFILIMFGLIYAVSGIKNILNNLEEQTQSKPKKIKKTLITFGNGPYGGIS